MKRKPWLAVFSAPSSIENGRYRLFNLLLLLLVLGLCAAVAVLAFDFGRNHVDADKEDAREQIEKLSRQIEQMASAAAVAESVRNIDQATQQQLVAQITALEKDNIRLKEDLSFFERLLPASPKAGGVTIRRLVAEVMPPNQLRYRLLIWAKDSNNKSGFSGQAQLTLTTLQAGKKLTILFPQPNSPEEDNFRIKFRHYQRLEGILTLPEGTVVKSVHASILENGQVRTQHSIKL